MFDFSSSIIREKLTFASSGAVDDATADEKKKPIIIRSNRIALNLVNGDQKETVVIRAQTAHVALALASKVMYSFDRSGFFTGRTDTYDWDRVWESLLSDYETAYNPNLWAVIYLNSKPIFRTSETPYVDIIEKCAQLHTDNYDASIEKAEMAFKKLGLDMKIEQVLSIAAVFNNQEKEHLLRCGIIQRSKGRNLTFNFIAEGGEDVLRVEQSLMVAGHFLEAINLNLVIRSLKGKVSTGDMKIGTPESRRLRHATQRMNALIKAIGIFEKSFDVRYRPEKPDLFAS